MENLVAGDIIQIKPGENIPADGTVVDGTSEIDESMLTGEAESVLKAPGLYLYNIPCHKVFHRDIFCNPIFQNMHLIRNQ